VPKQDIITRMTDLIFYCSSISTMGKKFKFSHKHHMDHTWKMYGSSGLLYTGSDIQKEPGYALTNMSIC